MKKWMDAKGKAKRRKQLAAIYGWKCHYCGVNLVPDGEMKKFCTESHGSWTPLPGYEMPHLDHIIPRSKGGKNDISNLVLSCGQCNIRKGTKSYEKFTEQL